MTSFCVCIVKVDDFVEELYEYTWSLEWTLCDEETKAMALCQAGFGHAAARDADIPDDDAAVSPLDAECLGYIPESDTIMEYRYHLEKGKSC